MKRQKRIIFIASSGGHLTQLLQLNPLFEEYNSFLITEKDKSTSDLEERFKDIKLYYFYRRCRTDDHLCGAILL